MTEAVESKYSKYVTVMWPVMDSEVPGAHCTSVFLGETDYLTAINLHKEEIVGGLLSYRFDAPGSVPVSTYEIFGDETGVIVGVLDKRIDTFRPPILKALENEFGLDDECLKTDYPFRGHVTLGRAPRYTDFQRSFYLGRPQLWWGDRRYSL